MFNWLLASVPLGSGGAATLEQERGNALGSCGQLAAAASTVAVATSRWRGFYWLEIFERWGLDAGSPVGVQITNEVGQTAGIEAFFEVDGDDVRVDVNAGDLASAEHPTSEFVRRSVAMGIENRAETFVAGT